MQTIPQTKTIKTGMIYAGISFIVSIIIGLYTYRFLWINADKAAFVAWLAVFEISQFLLLLDLGFTHKFIKNHINSDDETIKRALPELRGTLLMVGSLAAGIIFIVAVVLNHLSFGLLLPYILLSLSVLFSIVTYAETAVLKIKHRFNAVYIINIAASFVYATVLISGISEDVITTLSIAIITRALAQFIAQTRLLAIHFKASLPRKLQGSTDVIAMNASYFALFMLDAAILIKIGLPAATIALIIILRKYYDTLRGFWDSILSVASIGFAKSEDKLRDLLLQGGVIISYILAFLFANFLINLWLSSNAIDTWLSFGVGISGLALSIYRIESTRLYFQGKWNFFGLLAITFSIKLAYFLVLDNKIIDVGGAYVLQSVLLLILASFMVLRDGKQKKLTRS